MKIVFFGTPEFAVTTFESLAKNKDIEILAVITQPDKKVGRKQILESSPIKISAQQLNLPVIQPRNKLELTNALKKFKVDFFVVIAFGMILPKEILDMPKYGAINVHASLLPKYRGASPIQESLLNGDTETGISIIKIDEKLDHGKIYLLRRLTIEENDNTETLSSKLAKLSAEILPLVLEDIGNNNLPGIAQKDEKASFCRKIRKEDGKINWGKSAEDIKNMVRAYTKWPSAYTFFKDKKVKILSAKSEQTKTTQEKEIFFIENNKLKISTKDGNLLPEKLQMEGKNPVSAQEFINGYLK